MQISMQNYSYLFGLLAITTVLCLSGCGSPTAEVTGTVSLNGNPVTAGSVILQPIAAGPKPAAGMLDASGQFTALASGGDLVEPGEYKLIYAPPMSDEESTSQEMSRSRLTRFKAPEGTVTVVPGPNDFSVDLVPQ